MDSCKSEKSGFQADWQWLLRVGGTGNLNRTKLGNLQNKVSYSDYVLFFFVRMLKIPFFFKREGRGAVFSPPV